MPADGPAPTEILALSGGAPLIGLGILGAGMILAGLVLVRRLRRR